MATFEQRHPRIDALEPALGSALLVVVAGLIVGLFLTALHHVGPGVNNPSGFHSMIQQPQLPPAGVHV